MLHQQKTTDVVVPASSRVSGHGLVMGCLLLKVKLPSKMSKITFPAVQRHIPKDVNPQQHLHANLMPHY
jgi:hypothetical protein